MTIYVDQLRAYLQPVKKGARRVFGDGRESCHMICDGDLECLHLFAEGIGLRREWFQDGRIPHYDLTPTRRVRAVMLGAVEVQSRDLVTIWKNRLTS